MYEELVKSLRICGAPISCADCPHYADEDPNCFIRLKIEAADAIESLEEKAQAYAETLYVYEHPWISVTERLPRDKTEVLAYYGFVHDGEMSRCRFMGVVKYFTINANPHWQHEDLGLTVTHWMPLPQPPTEGSQMVTDSNQPTEELTNE